jgi:hypothetical protein
MSVIAVTQTDFDQLAFTQVTGDGVDAGSLPTFDIASSVIAGFPMVAAAVLLPATKHGMRIVSLEAAIESAPNFPRGLRLALLSYPGNADALAAILAQYPAHIGAYGTENAIASGGNFVGPYVMDLTAPGIFTLASGKYVGGSPNQIVGLQCHMDQMQVGVGKGTLPQAVGSSGRVALGWTADKPIRIDPQRSCAALFIAYRAYSGANPVIGTEFLGAVVRGAVHGFKLTDTDIVQGKHTPDRTPRKHSNALIAGTSP